MKMRIFFICIVLLCMQHIKVATQTTKTTTAKQLKTADVIFYEDEYFNTRPNWPPKKVEQHTVTVKEGQCHNLDKFNKKTSSVISLYC